jgi:predicted hydrocarbon binding protein
MATLTQEDRKIINSNKGHSYFVKGLMERLSMIEKNYGKEGVKRVEEEMQKAGYDFDISELKKKKIMPHDLFIAFLVVEAKIFDYDDHRLRAIGREMVAVSYITKFLSKFLISIDMLCKNANRVWKKYNPGELKIIDLDKKKKRAEFEIDNNPPGHPFYCRTLEGYIGGVFSLVVGKEAKCREEECVFDGKKKKHRFLVSW